MIKRLFATTAIAALMTTGALAASETMPAASTDASGTMTNASPMAEKTDSRTMDANGHMVSALIGKSVYSSSAEDAERIGEVDDLVVTPDGEISSAIIGVGGFLGIGEKDVAVEFARIEWIERDGDTWLVYPSDREALEKAPAFDRTALVTPAAPAGSDQTETAEAKADKPQESAMNDGSADKAEMKPDTMQTGSIDRTAMAPVDGQELSAEMLIGKTVYGINDQAIGEIGDVLLTAEGNVEGFVLDVGGFLGIGEKPVAVSVDNLDILASAEGGLTVFTPFSEETLKAQPDYDPEAYKADRNAIILIAPAG